MVLPCHDRSPLSSSPHLATWMTIDSGVVLRQRACRGCHAVFWICSYCDRGQRYCSLSCRIPARRQQRRSANRRHQRSPEGRDDHRDRQREYRRRCRIRDCVTDQGSASITSPGNMPEWDARSARTATRVGFATAFVQSLASPAWRRQSEKPQPPFLCCAWCGCLGRFVDPFPKIPRF